MEPYINQFLSKELKVEQIPEGETREFVLVNAGIFDPNFNGGQPVSPQGKYMLGEDIIIDPFSKEGRIRILNVVGLDPIKRPGEKTIFEPIHEKVIFGPESKIVCGPQDMDKYAYLKRSNKNRDNPYRITGKGAKDIVFYEVDDSKAALTVRENFEYTTRAGMILLELTDNEVFDVAKRVKEDITIGVYVDLNKNSVYLRDTLQSVTKSHPARFIEHTGNERGLLKILIDHADKKKFLLFNDTTKEWTWQRGAKEKGDKNIVTLQPGNKAVEALIDFMATAEGSIHKAELLKRREEYYPAIGK